MSTTIDQKVVEMRFDNKQFESGVSTTMSTLDKFKQKLKLTDASKGLEEVSAAAKKCDVSSVGEAAEKVGLKFNAMYSIADQALRNITNSAMMYGKRIVSALTIDPVRTGFSEYETQMNAVQTILANTESKGKTLDDVNGALDELNKYADKTIYNFTEMTRNIGTFTAAGVDLDTSVSAIKGIANLAAVSGSTSQQASTAMYQLSQAMASGTVKLMDWNSVVNAGMGGQVFQDALKETARASGVAIDDIIAKQGSFRESLSEGWLTTKILTDTLAKFTGDLSEEQLKAQGYTEQQIKDIMKLGQTANDAATKVKTFTQLFDTLKEAAQSGWTQTWEILVGDFEEAKELLTSISDTIGGMIGRSADARNELLENWKVLGGRQDLIESFKNIFEGIVSIVTPIKEAFREIFPPMTSERLKAFTEGFKNLTEKFKLSETTSNNLKRTFKGLFAVLDITKQIIGALFKAFGSLFGSVGDLGGGILEITAKFGDWLVTLSEVTKSGDIFTKVFGGIVTILKNIFKIASIVIKAITKSFILPGWEVLKTLLEKIRDSIFGVGDATGEMQNSVGSAFKSMGDAIENSSFYKLFSALWKIVATIGKALGSIASGLITKLGNADFSGILDFISALSLGTIAIYTVKFVKGFKDIVESVGSFKDSVLGILDSVRGCFEAYQDKLKADALKSIATAIAILVGSLLVLSLIKEDKLSNAISAITMLFVELLAATAVLGKVGGKKGLVKNAVSITTMASAILILSAALKILSTMSAKEAAVGLIAMATGLAALVVAINFLPEKKVGPAARAIKKLSISLLILAAAIKIMSTMSWKELAVGLIAMTAGLAALVGAINLLPKDTALKTLGVTSLATAMVILAAALKIMASMSWSELAVGLAAMAVSLGLFVAAIRLLPKDTGLKAIGILALATALVILASALKIMGSMSWKEIGAGLLTLGVSIGILAGGLQLMKNTLPGAAALLVAAGALAVMVPVLGLLGAMKLGTIIKGLVSIAATFAIFAVAGKLLAPVVPTIVSLAGAIALIGVGILAAGVGLFALGAGLASLAVGFSSIIASLSVIVEGIIRLVSALIAGVIKGVADGIVLFSETIADGAPTIGRAIKEVVLSLCDVLIECTPVIVETVLSVVVGLLESLVKYTPQLVDSLFQFIIGLIDGLARNLPGIITATMNVIGAFFAGVLEALSEIDTDSLIKGIAAVGLIAGLIAALAAIAPMVPLALVGVLGMSIVLAELMVMLSALGAIATLPGLDWLINKGGDLLELIGRAIGKFIGGIVGGIAQGVTGSLPEIGTDLSEFMANLKPFIEGAKQLDASALEGVKALVGVILSLTAANILDGIASWITGESSIASFAAELPLLGQGIKGFADAVAGISTEAVMAAVEAAKALAEMTSIIPNEGGVVSWFAGENSISKFAGELPTLGLGLKGFADAVNGISTESVIAAASAAKVLAEMTSTIPNEGGVVSWFAGDSSISNFADEIVSLGEGLKGFSDAVVGVSPDSVIAAAKAAKALAEMTSALPNKGGVVSWFAGESSVSKFADEIVTLGHGLKGFSDAVTGVSPENVTAAANSAKALAEMAAVIPNEGGVKSWFGGDNSVSKFAGKLPSLGHGLKGFSDSVAGVVPENITAAANAAKALAEMTAVIPNEGGIKAWFTGDASISEFAGELPTLGAGIKGFSDSVAGINPDSTTAAASAAKSLAEMLDSIPKNIDKAVAFADNIKSFGTKLAAYFNKIKSITPESVTASNNAIAAISAIGSVDAGNIKAVSNAIDAVVKSIKELTKISKNSASSFSKALKELGETSSDAFLDTFDDLEGDMEKKGKNAIDGFIDGVEAKHNNAKNAGKKMAEKAADGAADKKSTFKTAGKECVEGFADGITVNTFIAKAKAKAMAEAALEAAREVLRINSPSKAFRDMGYSIPEGLAMGIDRYSNLAAESAAAMADGSINGVKNSISHIADLINGDIDAQPTIRPVLDLSDVKSGARSIGGLFGSGVSIGATANIGAINSAMGRRNQNGTNNDVVSAINKLSKSMDGSKGDTYNFGNISYDDDSSIASAVRELVRAAKMERRV